MKFGLNQYSKPTPARVERFFDLIASVLGIVAGFLVAVDWVPSEASNIAAPIINILLVPVVLQLKKYFGSETQSQDIPVSQVDVIDENK